MTYSGGIDGTIPNGTTFGSGSAIPGVDISNAGTDCSACIAKLDEINAKLDHVLEHLHQPLTGTVHLECPPKVPSGQT